MAHRGGVRLGDKADWLFLGHYERKMLRGQANTQTWAKSSICICFKFDLLLQLAEGRRRVAVWCS